MDGGAKRPFSSAVVLLFVVPLLAVVAVAFFRRFTDFAAEQEHACRRISAVPEHVARCVEGTRVKGPLSVALAR